MYILLTLLFVICTFSNQGSLGYWTPGTNSMSVSALDGYFTYYYPHPTNRYHRCGSGQQVNPGCWTVIYQCQDCCSRGINAQNRDCWGEFYSYEDCCGPAEPCPTVVDGCDSSTEIAWPLMFKDSFYCPISGEQYHKCYPRSCDHLIYAEQTANQEYLDCLVLRYEYLNLEYSWAVNQTATLDAALQAEMDDCTSKLDQVNGTCTA